MILRFPRPTTGRSALARARTTVSLVTGLALALGTTTYAGAAAAATGGFPSPDEAQAAARSPFAEAGVAPTIDGLPRVVLDAHRGGGLEARENSLSGIAHALASGVVDVVDLDVRRLADGTLGVMHDATVDRVTTSSGPTSSYTGNQWQALRLDIGAWLVPHLQPEPPPTLSRVLERFGDSTVFTVEVKEGLLDELSRLLRATRHTDSVFVNTNTPDVARAIHEAGLHAHLWRTAHQMQTDDPRSFAGFADLLDLDIRATDADFRRGVRSGVPLVWAHTITTRAERERALSLGATGVVTDDPQYVAGVTDTFPQTPTVVEVRREPDPVQVSDRTTARVAVESQSGPSLRGAVVTVASPVVVGRTLERSDQGVSTLQVSARSAERGRTQVEFRVAAGRAGERRWPAGRTSVALRVTGEDVELVPSARVGRRGLRVDVRLRDSAAGGYDGPRPEAASGTPTPADLRGAGLRLRVIRRGEVVHRERMAGADTGETGDGVGTVSFSRWKAPRHGWCTVRVVQDGPVYRRVVVERRVRLG